MKNLTYKICILGNGGVGKTTLMRRYLTGSFESSTKMTLGVDFGTKYMKIDDFNVTLQIWDFAGEERFRFFLPDYSLGSSGAFYMFDLTRPFTLSNIKDWLRVFKPHPNTPDKQFPMILLGGKSDVKSAQRILKDEAESIAQKYNFLGYFETSSLTGKNVELVFNILVKKIIEKANIQLKV